MKNIRDKDCQLTCAASAAIRQLKIKTLDSLMNTISLPDHDPVLAGLIYEHSQTLGLDGCIYAGLYSYFENVNKQSKVKSLELMKVMKDAYLCDVQPEEFEVIANCILYSYSTGYTITMPWLEPRHRIMAGHVVMWAGKNVHRFEKTTRDGLSLFNDLSLYIHEECSREIAYRIKMVRDLGLDK